MSFLIRDGSLKKKKGEDAGVVGRQHMSTTQSEGVRTELKSMFEEDESGKDVIPALPKQLGRVLARTLDGLSRRLPRGCREKDRG